MSSTDNIVSVNQSDVSRKWAKDSAKYPLSGRLDIQKLLTGLDKEFKSPSEEEHWMPSEKMLENFIIKQRQKEKVSRLK
jgi:hypothetical protein